MEQGCSFSRTPVYLIWHQYQQYSSSSTWHSKFLKHWRIHFHTKCQLYECHPLTRRTDNISWNARTNTLNMISWTLNIKISPVILDLNLDKIAKESLLTFLCLVLSHIFTEKNPQLIDFGIFLHLMNKVLGKISIFIPGCISQTAFHTLIYDVICDVLMADNFSLSWKNYFFVLLRCICVEFSSNTRFVIYFNTTWVWCDLDLTIFGAIWPAYWGKDDGIPKFH